MSVGIFSIVLFAALLHALWNAVVKGAGDKSVMLGLIALGHIGPGFAMVALSPSPVSAAFPFIVASTVIHWGYYYLLIVAYRTGDLSVVYPIARGLAPILVALGVQFWIGEYLSSLAWVGVLLVSAGIMILAAGVIRRGLPMKGLFAALGVACCVAGYSIVDGIGVRLSGSALGYIGWLFAAEIIVAAYVFSTRWDRLVAMPMRGITAGILGGLISGSAYALVLYAKTMAPIGIVSALRETSVIFAAMIGVTWFGEGPKPNRIIAAAIVAVGIVIIGAVEL